MASETNKDLLTRLADRGEQVVGRITDLPGAKAVMDTTTSLGKRLDEVQKRLRSIDPLEKRLTALEKRVDKLDGKGSSVKQPAKKRTTSARSTTPKPKAQPEKPARNEADAPARLDAGLGHAQKQSPGNDLEGRRCRARLLAVQLDGERDRRFDRDLRAA